MILYIERWLKAPMQLADGTLVERTKGTPQGGVVSPVLSNLFLHYPVDVWMTRTFPQIPWCRYADDGLAHCRTEQQAQTIKSALMQRLAECGLEMHPDKSKIVYCKDGSRKGKHLNTEFDFLGYTFRPRAVKNRKRDSMFVSFSPAISHQALKQLDQIIMTKPINHIIDADIKGFFDHVDHDWMMKFLSHRISDPNFLRLIKRFLKNGYMEEGNLHATAEGTPQGGVVSPILANVYLHYALDLWIEKVVKRQCRGVVEIVRYADDKTRLIEFGRFAKQNAKAKDLSPATFNFLGFTHFIDRTRKGGFKLGRKTDGKKLRVKLKEMNQWLKASRNLYPIQEIWKTLRAKLRGHFQYYGVRGNFRSIGIFATLTKKLTLKWLNRRSQKKSFNWEGFTIYLKRHPLPMPAIHHDFYTSFASK